MYRRSARTWTPRPHTLRTCAEGLRRIRNRTALQRGSRGRKPGRSGGPQRCSPCFRDRWGVSRMMPCFVAHCCPPAVPSAFVGAAHANAEAVSQQANPAAPDDAHFVNHGPHGHDHRRPEPPRSIISTDSQKGQQPGKLVGPSLGSIDQFHTGGHQPLPLHRPGAGGGVGAPIRGRRSFRRRAGVRSGRSRRSVCQTRRATTLL
jgi:hypothetical protein